MKKAKAMVVAARKVEIEQTLWEAGFRLTDYAVYDIELRMTEIPAEVLLYVNKGKGNPHHACRVCLDMMAKLDSGWNEQEV